MQFDREKLKAVILAACTLCPPERLGAVKLHKVLYFLDMIAFAQRGRAVTGAIYVKRPFGPTCLPLLAILRDMERERKIEIRDVSFFGRTKKEYVALVSPDSRVLNDEEVGLLEEVVDFVCNQNTARSISDYSHQLPWEMAAFGETIPYSSALLLFPADVGPEAFDIVSEGVNEIADARRNQNTLDLPLLSAFRSRLHAREQGAGL